VILLGKSTVHENAALHLAFEDHGDCGHPPNTLTPMALAMGDGDVTTGVNDDERWCVDPSNGVQRSTPLEPAEHEAIAAAPRG
jgi:hypothetical protein